MVDIEQIFGANGNYQKEQYSQGISKQNTKIKFAVATRT